MSKKRTIRKPLPLKEQETAFSRMRGDCWIVDTSEPTVARELIKKGYQPIDDDGVGHYLRFELPSRALTIRRRETVDRSPQVKNLPNRPEDEDEKVQKPTKAGQNSTQDSTIGGEDEPSVEPIVLRPNFGRKSTKVGESQDNEPIVSVRK